ncbi:MAG: hypothetical protein DRM98_00740 [Thermoplasmata archaeon]|nr:MAG: hypothetical protein DRM98_00740 [Thermoplasmata archaeon]
MPDPAGIFITLYLNKYKINKKKMRLKHFSILFSITGITVLYILSLFSQPPLIELQELPIYKGKMVIVEGRVTKCYMTKNSGQMLTIENNNSTATVYITGRVNVEYGDILQVTGRVERFRESWEIIVDDEKSIQVLEKWNKNVIPIQVLADNPTKYLGLNIKTTGHIDMIYSDCFYLMDYNSGCSLLVFCNFSNIPFVSQFKGSKVYVTGVFSFDKQTLRYRLESYDSKHGILFPAEE